MQPHSFHHGKDSGEENHTERLTPLASPKGIAERIEVERYRPKATRPLGFPRGEAGSPLGLTEEGWRQVKILFALRPMVPAQGYYRLSPTVQIHLPHGRTVFIKQALFPTHRTPYQAFGARHPSSVTPRWGAPASPRGKPRGPVRIRPGFHEDVSACRNPSAAAAAAPLCMKQLYAIL